MYCHTYSNSSMDQPGKVGPARGPCPRSRLRIGLARGVRQSRPASACSSPYSQVESGAYLRNSSRFPRRHPFTYLKPPYAIGSVPSLSGHAIAYRCRSLPSVRRHRTSKPRGSSERVLPWQITMDQLICALSHRQVTSRYDSSCTVQYSAILKYCVHSPR